MHSHLYHLRSSLRIFFCQQYLIAHAKPQFPGLLANRMVGSLNFSDVTPAANGFFVLF